LKPTPTKDYRKKYTKGLSDSWDSPFVLFRKNLLPYQG
jgi:hypothetical protein